MYTTPEGADRMMHPYAREQMIRQQEERLKRTASRAWMRDADAPARRRSPLLPLRWFRLRRAATVARVIDIRDLSPRGADARGRVDGVPRGSLHVTAIRSRENKQC